MLLLNFLKLKLYQVLSGSDGETEGDKMERNLAVREKFIQKSIKALGWGMIMGNFPLCCWKNIFLNTRRKERELESFLLAVQYFCPAEMPVLYS